MVTLDFFCPLKQRATETDEEFIERAQRWRIRSRETRKAWKAKHPEKFREYKQRYEEAHSKERKERNHRYYVKHRERILYEVMIYAMLHKEAICDYQKRYYRRNRRVIIQRVQLRNLQRHEFWRHRTRVDKMITDRWRNDNGE